MDRSYNDFFCVRLLKYGGRHYHRYTLLFIYLDDLTSWEKHLEIIEIVGEFTIGIVLIKLLGVFSLLFLVLIIPISKERKNMIINNYRLFNPIFKLIFR